MGRGRMGSSGGGSRGSIGGGRSSGGFSTGRRIGRGVHSRTTIFIGGGHHHGGSSILGTWIMIVVSIPFLFAGLFMFIGGIDECADSFKYSTVKAESVLNEKVNGYYYTTYEYTVGGKDYRNRSMQSWEFDEPEGNVVTIYYLKSDPNKIYEEKPEVFSEGIFMIFGGLICAGLGSIPMVMGIKALKSSKNEDSSDSSSTSSGTTQEVSKRCAYCGARYNKNSDTCPKCGASKSF